MYLFKKGDRVRMNPNHGDYMVYMTQHEGNVGTIREDVSESDTRSTGHNVRVTWDNGHFNSYRYASLMLVESKELGILDKIALEWGEIITPQKKIDSNVPPKGEEVKMYELPPLTGQRVCLNPESKNFTYLLGRLGSDVGYVINPLINLSELIKWKHFSEETKRGYNVRVKFDNGKTYNISIKELLVVDTKPIDVEVYYLSTGDYFMVTNEEERKELDEIIIKHRARVERSTLWNNEKRAEVTEKILNS